MWIESWTIKNEKQISSNKSKRQKNVVIRTWRCEVIFICFTGDLKKKKTGIKTGLIVSIQEQSVTHPTDEKIWWTWVIVHKSTVYLEKENNWLSWAVVPRLNTGSSITILYKNKSHKLKLVLGLKQIYDLALPSNKINFDVFKLICLNPKPYPQKNKTEKNLLNVN